MQTFVPPYCLQFVGAGFCAWVLALTIKQAVNKTSHRTFAFNSFRSARGTTCDKWTSNGRIPGSFPTTPALLGNTRLGIPRGAPRRFQATVTHATNLDADCNSVAARLIGGKIKTPASTGVSTAFVPDRHAHSGVVDFDFATLALRCAVRAATGLLMHFAVRPAKNALTPIANRFNKIALSTPPTNVKCRIRSPLIFCLSQHRPRKYEFFMNISPQRLCLYSVRKCA